MQRLALLSHLHTLELADLALSNDAVARISGTLPNLTITQGRLRVVGLELPQDSSDAFRFSFTMLASANP